MKICIFFLILNIGTLIANFELLIHNYNPYVATIGMIASAIAIGSEIRNLKRIKKK